ERQLADAQLRLDPERDQAARAAEAIKREKEAEELKQITDEFVEAGARLAEALRQVTAVSFTTSEAAAIVVKAVSEIVEATKVINGDLESYVRFVVSGSAPLRRQPMPVTLVETLAPTPTTLPILPALPELPTVPLFQGAAAWIFANGAVAENIDSSLTLLLEHAEAAFECIESYGPSAAERDRQVGTTTTRTSFITASCSAEALTIPWPPKHRCNGINVARRSLLAPITAHPEGLMLAD